MFCSPSIVNCRVVALATFAFQHSTVLYPNSLKRRLLLYHEIFNCTRCVTVIEAFHHAHDHALIRAIMHHASCIIPGPACDQYTLSPGVSLSPASYCSSSYHNLTSYRATKNRPGITRHCRARYHSLLFVSTFYSNRPGPDNRIAVLYYCGSGYQPPPSHRSRVNSRWPHKQSPPVYHSQVRTTDHSHRSLFGSTAESDPV